LNAILSSLAAFLATLMRPRTPLAKAIVLTLAIKLMAIAGIGIVMLSGRERPVVDAMAMSRLIGPSVTLPSRERH
jgi:hypothetical protein